MAFHLFVESEELAPLLKALMGKVDHMAKTLAEMQTAFQTELDKLTGDVTAQTTVIASAVTLLQGLAAQNAAMAQQIKDLIAAGGDASVLQPLVDGLEAQAKTLEANSAALAAAVTANTPAA